MLLIAGIGIFQSGRLFERDAIGIEAGAEAVEDLSAAQVQPEPIAKAEDSVADVQPEISETAADLSALAEDTEPSDAATADSDNGREQTPIYAFYFRKAELLQEHFDKHGAEFGYTSTDEYLEGANRVIASAEALHKLEAEDGDDVYYLEATNEFVIVSTDGYLRTYFKPEDGKAYFDRQ